MKDKVIVITGGSEGIGAAVAQEVAKRGAKVVVAARNVEKLEAVAKQIGALAVQTDVTKRSDNERLRDRALEKFGAIDVWINNAGRGISKLVSELTDEDVDDMMLVNVKSVVYGIQAVLPHMKERGHGQIISVSSGLSRFPFAPQRSAYSAAKAAVNLLMASLRVELKKQFPNIYATTVLPGVVATDFGNNAKHGGIDSRKMPDAQPVEEVGTIIADVIEKARAEVYTRPQMLQLAAKYFSAEDVSQIEAGFVR
jgi:NAD(P)-dependent dehydrogenase (short-subunit alcohol dehydrogenase family)